ncbi:hypothetical protein QM012_005397 [Aureobasidium pullulans]|uniref:Protein kinase domain-containing protein n=1 Tax=Aureobasidium pullulans TaxID=5580 RepID=A0ABR0T5P7_AURPU
MKHSYYIRGGSLGETVCHIQVMRSNVQFYFTVKSAIMQNTLLGSEYLRLVDKVLASESPDMETCFAPYHLILMHFLPLLTRLAPRTSVSGITLEDFVRAPTYHLEVVSTESGEPGIEGQDNCTLTPAYDIAPLSTSEAPDLWKTTPKISAESLISERSETEMNPLKSVQGKVRTADGSYKYLKPRERGRETEFHREVHILHRIKQEGLAGSRHRLPVLESFVVSGEKQENVGILMNLIVSPDLGSHLMSPGFRKRVDLHKRWEKQVSDTVRLLHKHGIIWGDVNPCNVAIDEDMNAWVIDFGGRNTVEFVDDDKAETAEGDRQGVQRLFENWLPSQVVSDHD